MKISFVALIISTFFLASCDSGDRVVTNVDQATQTSQGTQNIGKLVIGNLKEEKGGMSFVLANTSDKAGQIVIWVAQGDYDLCTYKSTIKANTRYDMTIVCNYSKGEIVVRADFAELQRDRFAIAKSL